MTFDGFLKWMRGSKVEWYFIHGRRMRAYSDMWCPLQVWVGSRLFYRDTAQKRGMSARTIDAIIRAADGNGRLTSRNIKRMRALAKGRWRCE